MSFILALPRSYRDTHDIPRSPWIVEEGNCPALQSIRALFRNDELDSLDFYEDQIDQVLYSGTFYSRLITSDKNRAVDIIGTSVVPGSGQQEIVIDASV